MDSTKQEAGKREGISMSVRFPEMVGKFEVEYALDREFEGP